MMASPDVDMMNGSNSNNLYVADASVLERELNEKYDSGILAAGFILTI